MLSSGTDRPEIRMEGEKLMNYDFALRAQKSGQPMIRIVDAYMRRDPTFLAFAEGNPAIEACPK